MEAVLRSLTMETVLKSLPMMYATAKEKDTAFPAKKTLPYERAEAFYGMRM